jgi:hypothetical protein
MKDTITNVDKTKLELKETMCVGVDWIQVPPGRDQILWT